MYIAERFLPNISEDGAKRILNALWKFVFVPSNQQEIDNQNVNYYALIALYEKYEDAFIREVSNNKEKYQVDSSYIDHFICLLQKFPRLFHALNTSLKTLIKASIKKFEDFWVADFLSANLKEHYSALLEMSANCYISISRETIAILRDRAAEKGLMHLFIAACIYCYTESSNFNTADERFTNFIEPFLSEYTLTDVMLLMEKSNCNSQVYNRHRASLDHPKVLARFYELEGKEEQLENLSHWKNCVQNT